MVNILKHVFCILLIVTAMITGIFLPFVHGDYDSFAIGISSIVQVAAFTSLLFVPIGAIWLLMDLFKEKTIQVQLKHVVIFRKISIGITIIVILAAALGSFMSQNRFAAIVILLAFPFILFGIHKKGKGLQAQNINNFCITPYYFVVIPLSVVALRLLFFETAKNQSTDFVIQQSEQLIQDIESYKKKNGHYPFSIQSTIEDYKTNVSGIERFHYELNGDAYNLYFEQFSNMLGTEEIVMYNKLDEHEMTVHNQDLLRIPSQQIMRGYHQVKKLPQSHWKIFYFD